MKIKKFIVILELVILFALFSPVEILADTDTTPPQLEISTPSKQIWNSTVILHGTAIDESGVQKVTVNGIETTETFTNIHCIWIMKVNLNIGVNTFIIKAYDNSANHNFVETEYSLWYNPTTYHGPTIKLISIDTLPSNNATIRCIVNPNGYPTDVYLSYAEQGVGHSPFNSGRGGWCPTLTGTEDVVVEFTFSGKEQKNPGTKLQYIFKAENSQGFAYSRLGNLTFTDPIELPPTPDTTPPDSVVWDASGEINMPYVWVHGEVWDENGVSKVTVNGRIVEGTRSENYFFWKYRVELNEGKNNVNVTAYDNSLNRNAKSIVSEITYQKTGYTGPTINLIPFENLPIDNAIMRLQFNPNNNDYTWIYRDGYSSSGSSGGQSLGHGYSGSENQTLTYLFPQDWLSVGETIHIIFKIGSRDKWSFAEANFTVIPPDYIPPKINSVYPKDKDTGVSLKPEISIVFNEHLNIYTITSNIIKINGQNVTGALIYSHNTHTILFKPLNSLEYGKDYTITISKDIEDYDGNKLGQEYKWSFRTVEPVIDEAYCKPEKADVGNETSINFHLQWSNSTAIEGANLIINGKTYTTNSTGWITFTNSSSTIVKKTWSVTELDYRGITQFKQIVTDPSCSWDRVSITFDNNIRTSVGDSEIKWKGEYVTDHQSFMGTLLFNDTLGKLEVGKYIYQVTSINDPQWGITSFTSSPFSVIYDRVDIELKASQNHINVGTSPIITTSGFYEYDLQNFAGKIELTQPSSVTIPGVFTYRVSEIYDPLYGITVFKSNVIEVVWDQIKITETGVSSNSVTVNEAVTFWCKAVYEYSDEKFDGTKGLLYVNGEAMTYIPERQRWEIALTSKDPKQMEIGMSSVQDNQYGLTMLNVAQLPKVSVEWKSAGVPGYPIEAVFLGVVFSVCLLLYNRKRFFQSKFFL